MSSATDRSLPIVAAVVLAAAAVAAFALPRTAFSPRPAAGSVATAADGFLAAWERSRTETYVVEWQFTRVTASGGRLAYASSLAQRPPDDRLLVGSGAVDGRRDGRVLRCGTDPDGRTRCFPGPPAPPYDDEVEAEMERLGSYVSGDRPLYSVAAGSAAGCFVLELALALPSPPYGDRATFCFDRATGARTRTVIERPEATDTTEVVSVRSTVTDADFTVPDSPSG